MTVPRALQGNRPRWGGLATGLVGASVCLAALGLAGPVGCRTWLCDLAAHFPVQYLLAGVALAALAVLFRRALRRLERGAIGVSLAMALVVSGMTIAPFIKGVPDLQPARTDAVDRPGIRILSLNLWWWAFDVERTAAFLKASEADVISLQEYAFPWRRPLASTGALAAYPHRLAISAEGHGMAIFSKWPIVSRQTVPAATEPPILVAEIETPHGPLRIVNAHPKAPVSPHAWRVRNRDLEILADIVGTAPRRTVVLGDFNVTPFAPAFADFLDRTGLADSRRSLGVLAPSFPAPLPAPLRIPIDHILVSGDLPLEALAVGPYIGSDHRPLTAIVGIPPVARPP